MQTDKFILNLIDQTNEIITDIKKIQSQDLADLTWKIDTKSWSILECIEHLNLYGNFYLKQIDIKIKNSSREKSAEFKSGFLGNYFSKLMLPKEKLNKMKTAKDKDPLNSNLNKNVIDTFLQQQNQFLELLQLSKDVDLNKVKIKTSISPFIKLKLGDTFQFLVNHNLRHLRQIKCIQQEKNAI